MDCFHFIYIYIVVIFIYINSLQETSAHGKRWLTVDKRQTTGRSSSRTRQMYHEHELRTASPRGGWVESDRIGWRWVVGGLWWYVVGGRWLVVAGRKTQSLPETRIQFLACSQGALDAKLSSVRPLCDFHALHVCVCVWVRRCECVATKVSQMTLVCRDGVSKDFYYISYFL